MSLALPSPMVAQRKLQPAPEVALIINARSRSGPFVSEAALAELERLGVRITENHLAESGPEVMAAVRRAIASGVETVVVGGGDGTLSAVVDLFANRPDLTLGLLPVGTGNEMARELGIPLDLPGACGVIADGQVEQVDLAEANGNFFLHTAMVGYPVEAEQTVPAWLKRGLGKVAYVYSFLRSLLGSRTFRATVTANGERWEGHTALIVAGNGRFHGPTRVLFPDADPTEAGLVVYTPRDSRPAALVRLAAGIWLTRRPQPSLFLSTRADSVTIEADPPQTVGLDGEFGRLTPVSIRLARRALRVLVPHRP